MRRLRLAGKTTTVLFVRFLCGNAIILPRQARGKHWEKHSKKSGVFLQWGNRKFRCDTCGVQNVWDKIKTADGKEVLASKFYADHPNLAPPGWAPLT